MISVAGVQVASAVTVGLAQLFVVALVTTAVKLRGRFTSSNLMILGAGVLSAILAIHLHLKAIKLEHATSLVPGLSISNMDEASLVAVILINLGWVYLAQTRADPPGRLSPRRRIAITALSVCSIALLGLLRFGMGIAQGKLSI